MNVQPQTFKPFCLKHLLSAIANILNFVGNQVEHLKVALIVFCFFNFEVILEMQKVARIVQRDPYTGIILYALHPNSLIVNILPYFLY